VGLYIASWVLGKVTKEIDEWEEIKKGNAAVAIYMAGIFISVAVIIGPGIIGLFRTLNIVGIAIGFIQLIIALVLAMVMQYIGLSVLNKLTKGVNEWVELKNGNIAIGIMMASIVIAVSAIVARGVESLIAALFA
jgi:uncharacterized membrane protein YjfL (UPF0719 family)